ncbi:hypothetical protein [Aestuariivirga sp.]|uniref:hypothetical protein n=1 Tax=Aestuariivirga sp. TaxID=2650926 RepID=UPI003BADB89F
MKKATGKKDGDFFTKRLDPTASLHCIIEMRAENYSFERYVEFWRLLSHELFDGDAEATNLVYLLSASRVLGYLDSGKCLVSHERISESKSYLLANVLSLENATRGMQLLTNYFPFWDNLFEVMESATIGTAIIDELIDLEKTERKSHNSRPSLTKAIAAAREHKEFGGQWSVSSWKGLWRDYATDLPLSWAIWEANLDIRGLCGESCDSVERFQDLLAENPECLLRLLGLAKTAQLTLLRLVDKASLSNKKFLRFPAELPTVLLPEKRRTKNFYELESMYGPRDAQGG